MKHLFLTLLFAALCVTAYGQTIKTLGYNTNGQVVYAGTNVLNFTNSVRANRMEIENELFFFDETSVTFDGAVYFGTMDFQDANAAGGTRTNLGLGATWLTNTNVTNFRTAIGLGATNEVEFAKIKLSQSGENPVFIRNESGGMTFTINTNDSFELTDSFAVWRIPFEFNNTTNAATTRTNLGLGATNNVAFRNITSDGNITISNQSATNNGLLFIYRTNNEPFLGLANLIASNNTTISNETLFRVGVAEATNKAAQFGFRSTNTNGSGVAVFSVFGYNALMMIGADASTNAVVYSGGGTNNEVMTLIRDGATEFARPIRFSTNASTRPSTNAPVNTTNVAAWIEFRIGTNSYRAPLYQ
jgi:hypothetical protein